MEKYSIGLDFGTLSVRAVTVSVADGKEKGSAEYRYPHGVIAGHLPSGTPLPDGWALQHPQDYLDGISHVIRESVAAAGVNAEDIVGIGLDFTSCTFLPTDREFVPLCLKEKYSGNPHAWVKLWKHHGESKYAAKMADIARRRNEPFLKYYDGNVSPEWMLPRILEIIEEAPDIYDAADRFIEAGDWIVALLTGKEHRSKNIAGFKALWTEKFGYPSEEYLAEVNPKLKSVVREKLSGEVYPLGPHAGVLGKFGARLTGLNEGIPVASACIDAQAVIPLIGDVSKGGMVMCIGTSTGIVSVSPEFSTVRGVTGIAENGIIPGMFAYESAQRCVGDILDRFVETSVPYAYRLEAERLGMNMHQYLTSLAEKQRPGQSGLLALNWWNGNRSILCNYDLSGLILGITPETRPEEIYRAYIEATAYGARKIIECYEKSGIIIDNLYACGGITKKNAMFMQIYADILKKDIRILKTDQGPALGSAIFAAAAGGAFGSINEAACAMGGETERTVSPNTENTVLYDRIYSEYCILHDYFGCGENDVMKRMREIKNEQGVTTSSS